MRSQRQPSEAHRRFETIEERLAVLTEELRSTAFTLMLRLERMQKRVDLCMERVEQNQQRLVRLERRQARADSGALPAHRAG